MSLYTRIERGIFKHPPFKHLPLDHKGVVFGILCGADATMVPGLVESDRYRLASTLAITPEEAHRVLCGLVASRFAEVDEERGQIRIPCAPMFDRPTSDKVLIGMFKVWTQATDGPLKFRHVDSIKQSVDFGITNMSAAWAKTFGAVKVPTAYLSDTHAEGIATPHDGHGKGTADHTDHVVVVVDVDVDVGVDVEKDFAAGAAGGGSAGDLFAKDDPQAKKAADKKPKPAPLPFTAQQASDALQEAAGVARYTSVPVGKFAIEIQKLIKAHPSLDDFRTLGAYLAAGGDVFPSTKAPGWLAKTDGGVAAMKRALDWHANGRPAIAPGNGNGRSIPNGSVDGADRGWGSDPTRGKAPVSDWTGIPSGRMEFPR